MNFKLPDRFKFSIVSVCCEKKKSSVNVLKKHVSKMLRKELG